MFSYAMTLVAKIKYQLGKLVTEGPGEILIIRDRCSVSLCIPET
jgi:hypothetical protein